MELASLPCAKETWEMTVFYSQNAIGEGPRLYWPKLGLVVESKTGVILAFHLSGPEQTMSNTVAQALVKSISATGGRPAMVKLGSLNVLQALKPVGDALGINLIHAKSLPSAAEARNSLATFSGL